MLIEPGAVLRIEGGGFTTGQGYEVRLMGRTFRPGLPEVSVFVVVTGRALSQDVIEAPLDAVAITALGVRGSFEGDLHVAFVGRDGKARVSVGLALRLDLSKPDALDEKLRDQASQLLNFAGISASPEASLLSGLVIAEVRPQSPAEALDLEPLDVITRASGVAIHSWGDLAPPPHAPMIELHVRRPSQRSERMLRLSLAGFYTPDLSVELSRLSLALGWLFTCVLLLSPLPSLAAWLGRNVARLRRLPAFRLGMWGGEVAARSPARAALYAVWLPVTFSMAGVALVVFEPAGMLAVRSLSLYLGLLALSVTLTLMSDGRSYKERLSAAGTLAARMVVMGVLIACACALYGTRSFQGMVEGQGAWPWRWAAFQKPALLLAFPFYVVFASRLGATTLALEARGHAVKLLVVERVLTNVVLCALGAAIFAGGWQTPAELALGGLHPLVLGAVLFVAKAWAFAWLLLFVRHAELGAGLSTLIVTLSCFAIVGLTACWLWLQPSAAFELALGRALFASLTLVVMVATLSALRFPRARQESVQDAAAPPVRSL